MRPLAPSLLARSPAAATHVSRDGVRWGADLHPDDQPAGARIAQQWQHYADIALHHADQALPVSFCYSPALLTNIVPLSDCSPTQSGPGSVCPTVTNIVPLL
jgi:hypothetical protein